MTKLNKSRKFIATSATAALVASAIVPVASAAQINDFNSISSYAQEAVQDLSDRGVIKGDQKGNFNPTKPVTRAEAATILTSALELEATGSINFTDVKSGAWYYDAIKAAVSNGIFQGQGAGKFNPSGNLTRSEAAIILVDAFGLEGTGDLSEFKDAGSVKSWATEALEIAVANGVMKGDNGNLNPNKSISRQEFAVMYSRTEAIETSEVSGSVKAINNTTVEVTFEEAVTDLNALNFAIEGLTISNKSVKQTDSKTVVLTTSAQTADVEYTVSVNEEKIGKFKGVSAVIPTAIDVTTKSIQGVLGKEVTVSAKVTVAAGQSAAGIPVTFNIPAQGSLANAITAEAVTNADGVASYNYTRYTAVTDDVVAYATGDRTKFSAGKVYWATAAQLTVKDVTGVTSLANNDKKVYEIESAKNADKFVFVAFNENLGVTADKVVRTVYAEGSRTYLLNSNNSVNETTNLGTAAHPYEITTGSKAVIAVKLDSKGKANLVLTGANGTVTPVVYEGVATDSNDAGSIAGDLLAEFTNASYNPTALQAKASTVKFEVKHSLGLTIEALGVANAATYKNTNETGGRDYTVTYIDKDGKPAPATTAVQVAIPVQQASNGVFLVDADGNKVQGTVSGEYRVFPITVRGKEGKATFTVSADVVTQYVEPIAWIDNGTGVGAKAGLDATDLQAKGAATHFTESIEFKSSLKLVDAAGDEIKSVYANGTDAANFQYDTVDQNGKPRAYRLADGTTPSTNVTFSVTAGTSSVTAGGRTVTAGNPQTFNATVQGGRTSTTLAVTSLAPTTATVSATASVAGLVLATTNSVTASFTNTSTANVTGAVTNVNKTTGVVTIGSVPYSLVGATYLNNGTVVPTLAAFYDHITVGKEVSVTKDKDGNLVFNVKGDATSNSGITSAVLSEDGAKFTLTFAQNIDATLTGTLTAGDFTFTESNGTTAVTPTGTLAYALEGNNKVVISGITGGLEATDIVNVAADALVFVGGTTNVKLTKSVTQPFASKLSVLSVVDASVKAITASNAKDAVADVKIDDVTFTVTVDKAGTFKAENYNGVKVKFEAAGSVANPTAEYDAIGKVITVKVGNAAATNKVSDLETAIQAIAATASLDFSDITLVVTGTTTNADVVDVVDVATSVTVALKDGLSANAGKAGKYTFKLNTNLVEKDKVVLSGKTYTAGSDFVVTTTVAGTQANLAAAINAAIAAGTEDRFVTAVDATGVITLTDAAATGATAPVLSINK